MVTPPSLTFSEALLQFVAHKKSGKKALEGHQEISRFIVWIGRERKLGDLSPSEVADYAQYIGLGGAESAQRLGPVKTFLGFLKDEGLIQNSLATHLRVPRSRRSSSKRAGGADASVPRAHLSQEGYDRLIGQLETLKGERVDVVEEIKRAMADKDFRENAPLDAAKERQGIIEARIRELEVSLDAAQILSDSPGGQNYRVAVGNKVTLKDMSSGKKVLYTLVDMREADVSAGRISTVSPVGQALIDRAVGDEVSINVPRGTLHYLIEKVGT